MVAHIRRTTRRELLVSALGGAVYGCASRSQRIARIRYAPIECRFHKFVAMNSYDEGPKGGTYGNTLVRIETADGAEGVATMAYEPPDDLFAEALQSLIGANPLEIYESVDGRIGSAAPGFADLLTRYKHLDGPLFDLIGKLTARPCWQLIGKSTRERVEVYDGTLYFSDVWFRDRGIQAVVDEAQEAVQAGYRGIKLKVGRGSKWMEPDAGLARDIEVVLAVREAVGPEVKVLTDANNGYRGDFEGAWTYLSETQSAQIHWIEEIFPERPEEYTQLRAKMREAGMSTLIADGESVREPADFAPYLEPARLMDVLQMDIRTGGIRGCLKTARMAAEAGAVMVPHNWASQVGLFESLHLAKAMKSVVGAEDHRGTCDAIRAEGYHFEDGHYTVSDAPGWGISVDEDVYRTRYAPGEVVIA